MSNAAGQDDALATAPRDRALPQLERALDAQRLAERLGALAGARGALAARVLKHTTGKRCVIGYEFEDGVRVVGKLYRKDRARGHAAVLAELGGALDGSVRVPRLLACWEDLGLVLQEWVPGAVVPEYEALGDRPGTVLQLAAALADFHATTVRSGPHATLADHVRRTCGAGIVAIAAAAPGLGAALRDLESAMYAREAAAPFVPGPCHGDFGPRQVLVDGARVWFVDLDGFCQADPAFDVASFRVGLETHLGPAGGALGDRFLDAYRARRGGDGLRALAHHEAFCALRRAVILWRRRPAGWEDALRRTVERGRSRL